MKLYTTSLPIAKALDKAVYPITDITVKSGDKVFAPTWELLMRYKNGLITKEEYTPEYIELMRASYRANKLHWLELCSKELVVIACYCNSKEFCHRHILKILLEKVCKRFQISFEYLGELPMPKKPLVKKYEEIDDEYGEA